MTEEVKQQEVNPSNYIELEETIKDASTSKTKPKKREEDTNTEDTPEKDDSKGKEKETKKGPKYWTKDEWEAAGKDPDKYKSKEQFDKDGEFFKKIDDLNKTIKKLESKLYQTEKDKYQNNRTDLESRRFKAITEADALEVYKLNEEISKLSQPEDPTAADRKAYKEKVEKADEDFNNRNRSWLEDVDQESMNMKDYAFRLVTKYEQNLRSMEIEPDELARFVESKLKEKYPHRFKTSKVEEDTDDENSLDDAREAKEDLIVDELSALREELAELKKPKKYSPVEEGSYTKSRASVKDIPREYRDAYLSMPEAEKQKMPIGKYLKMIDNIQKNRGAIEI